MPAFRKAVAAWLDQPLRREAQPGHRGCLGLIGSKEGNHHLALASGDFIEGELKEVSYRVTVSNVVFGPRHLRHQDPRRAGNLPEGRRRPQPALCGHGYRRLGFSVEIDQDEQGERIDRRSQPRAPGIAEERTGAAQGERGRAYSAMMRRTVLLLNLCMAICARRGR